MQIRKFRILAMYPRNDLGKLRIGCTHDVGWNVAERLVQDFVLKAWRLVA